MDDLDGRVPMDVAAVVDVVRDLTPQQYLALQSVVHRIAGAVGEVTQPEHTYLLSLGSMQGNAHIHWHVVPLPPGVPYEKPQYHALMAENGILDHTPSQLAALATQIRAALAAQPQ